MYLIMEDKSLIAQLGVENGFSNKKYVEIPDELVEILHFSFIQNLKSILRDSGYRYIKKRKKYSSDYQGLCLGCLVEKNDESIQQNYKHEWKRDVRIVLSCFQH